MKRWGTGLIALCLLLGGCGGPEAGQQPSGRSAAGAGAGAGAQAERPEEPPAAASQREVPAQVYDADDVDPRAVQALNGFAFDLFRDVSARERGNANVFLSPVSAAFALSMTMNGAEGETLDGMLRALRTDGLTVEDVNRSHRALADVLLHSGDGVRLDLANSLWTDESKEFLAPFLDANRTYYDAEAASVDLQSDAAVERINGWVNERTEGKIEKLLDEPLSDNAILLLMNAIYFDAVWASPFPEDSTAPHPFRAEDGTVADASMMFRNGKLPYLDAEGFQAVRLPYWGGELSMLVFVPDEGSTVANVVDRLSPEAWTKWMGSFEEASGRLGLPKFRIEYETSLNESLKALGMELAFDPDRADFDAMIDLPENVYISEVKQKTFVDVAERGTVAAAVTGVTMETASAPSKTFDLVVDRPFLFAIHDSRTDSILFLGTVHAPASGS